MLDGVGMCMQARAQPEDARRVGGHPTGARKGDSHPVGREVAGEGRHGRSRRLPAPVVVATAAAAAPTTTSTPAVTTIALAVAAATGRGMRRGARGALMAMITGAVPA